MRKLVISNSICREEFGSDTIPASHYKALKRSLKIELATIIKGETLPPGTRLLKVYATSPEGPRRVVHLLTVSDGTLFLLLYRDKKDKVGQNVSIRNPLFRAQLLKNLRILQKDLTMGNFITIEEE